MNNAYPYKRGDRFHGGLPPFGFLVEDGWLVEDPEQQAAKTRMIRLRKDGRSFREIAVMLRPHGVFVSHMTVRRVLDQAGVEFLSTDGN
jgi:hypothetical protein